jgi:peptidoglycan/xylan/chitin deacetylase (PgdA/CDA1 family)
MLTISHRIPVLMYHRVGIAHNAWEGRYCVSPNRFAEHMHRLAAQGRQACSLGDFFAWLEGNKELPEGSFLLTFDDGFLGVYEHAVPVLQDLGWPATVFLVSRLIGGQDVWCQTENPAGVTYPLMTRKDIEAMRVMGFSFHSHTRLHPDLTTLSDDELTQELTGSRKDLEELLQEPVTCLAYPYGQYDERVVTASRNAGYRIAFSTQPGFNRQNVDRYRIRRLDISGTDTPAMLERKVFFGSNDGSWRHSLRYYGARIRQRLGL